jgi:hypothetical protein
MTGNRSGVSATRMRAQIILVGVTIAFVPADQGCRAERRLLALRSLVIGHAP